MPSQTELDHQQSLQTLLSQNQLLSLATLNKNHEAEASAAPYIFHDQVFWIFVSQLSSHTQNLLEHKQASILINENNSQNIFATTRVTIQCKVEIEKAHDNILDIMTEQLGETVILLRQLPDFYLLKLIPQSGRFIAGFGQAFDIRFPEIELIHINPANNN